MPQFRYRAVPPTGEFVVGEVEAPSRQEVLRRIEYLGHLAIEAEVARSGALARSSRLPGMTPRRRDVTVFLRELALLLEARVTLEAALQTLGCDVGKSLARFAGALRQSISAGESFAEALQSHPAIIEPAYVAMVRAGEVSGNLPSVLRAIVDNLARRQLLAERIGSAVRYPCFLIASAVVILVFFLLYVVPQFEPVLKDLGGRLNSGAAFVVAASSWLRSNLDAALLTCIAAILVAWFVFRRGGRRGERSLRCWHRCPALPACFAIAALHALSEPSACSSRTAWRFRRR